VWTRVLKEVMTEVYNHKVLDLIRKIYENGGIIASMCVASLAVAKTGILKGKKKMKRIKKAMMFE
jgi:putative intracellular protease/amidase